MGIVHIFDVELSSQGYDKFFNFQEKLWSMGEVVMNSVPALGALSAVDGVASFQRTVASVSWCRMERSAPKGAHLRLIRENRYRLVASFCACAV